MRSIPGWFKQIGLFCCFLLAVFNFALGQHKPVTPHNKSFALVIPVSGSIGPAMRDFITAGLKTAQQESARVVILQIDTPGGLVSSTRDIVHAILASPVPVISYVAPSGAHAASAGTYLMYAAPLAVMAPGTHLGAATSIALNAEKTGEKSTAEQKSLSDAQAYLRTLAQLHGRNVKWTADAINKSASLSADEALKQNVINFVAEDVPQLLQKINHHKVKINRQTLTLQTQGLSVHTLAPTARTKFLMTITDPNVAYLLLLLGFYGIIFEFMNPGYVAPGVIGGIAFLVGLYAMQLLSVNYVGLALLLLGLGLIVAEVFVASFGVLGIGGLVSFILGSIFLWGDATGIQLSWLLIGVMTIITASFLFILITFVVKARNRPIVSGREALINQIGVIESDGENTWLRVGGERWQFDCGNSLAAGERVRVLKVTGLTLVVERVTD